MERDPNTGRYISGSTWRQNDAGTYETGQPSRVAMSSQACSRLGSTTGLMSLIGGAGLGAVAMYLMDPDKGPTRRAHALDAANRALATSTDAISGAYETTAHTLGHAGHRAWDSMPSRRRLLAGAGAFGGSARDTAGSWLESARGVLPQRRQRTWLDSARSMIPGHHEETWLDSAKAMLPHRASSRRQQHEVSTGGATLTALGCVALGVGVMWLMDPQRGRGRRAWLVQKGNRYLNETGRFMRATGRHLANKSRGYAHRAQSVSGLAGSSDESLAERVRSMLGRRNVAGSVGVRCENSRVILTGRCAADDVDAILSTCRSVPGVAHVENMLDVGDRYPSGQASA